MSDRLKTTTKKCQNSDYTFNVNPFQPLGFVVQARSEESTPATKAQLWENYQQAKQLNQNSAKLLPIQSKLTIGQPGDKYEQEADSVADRVMAMSEPAQVQREELPEEEELQMKPLAETISPLVQREELPEEEEELQMKPEDNVVQREELPEEEELQMKSVDNSIQREELPEEEELQMKQSAPSTQTATPDLESQLSSSKGGGSPLSDDVRSFMEPRFGADFSSVRVHTGSDAVQMNQGVNAQAFAHGSDIYFGAGKAPGKDALTAHELTHVVQQSDNLMRTEVLQRKEKPQILTDLSTKLELMQANARLVNSHYQLGSAYVNLSAASTDLISTKLRIFSLNYDMAYSNYAQVIGQGRAEAQNQTLWRGIFLGIGTGVLAGLAAAYIAPSAAGAWFTLTLADAGAAAGSSFLQATASSVIAYAASDLLTAKGSDLQPGGLSPDMLKSNIWQHVALMYRGTLQSNDVLKNLHNQNIILEKLIAEMRVQIAGGKSKYSAEDILLATNTTIDRINRMSSVFSQLSQKATAMRELTSSISTYDPAQPGVSQMEKDIWIMWMGTLSNDDSDILDLDSIEDRLHSIGILGKGGMLGVDFGSYTSEDDELAALAAARPLAATIKNKYDSTASQWAAPSP